MTWLKQSTARTLKFGPFVDSGDFVTVEDSLTIQKADVRLSKNGGNMAAASADQGGSDAGAAHDELGFYDISLDTTDTDTLGHLDVIISESGALTVWERYEVVPANVWDSMFGADLLDVSATQIEGTDATDALATAIAAALGVYDGPTNAELATALAAADDAVLAAIAALNNPSAGTIADAVWDEALVELTGVPTITAPMRQAMAWFLTIMRNRRTQSATQEIVYKDDETTALASSAKTDNGTVFTRGEYEDGGGDE